MHFFVCEVATRLVNGFSGLPSSARPSAVPQQCVKGELVPPIWQYLCLPVAEWVLCWGFRRRRFETTATVRYLVLFDAIILKILIFNLTPRNRFQSIHLILELDGLGNGATRSVPSSNYPVNPIHSFA